MIFANNKIYDVLKYIAFIAIPAVGIFWATISKIWGIPNGLQICGTIDAVGVLLGALLMVSGHKYNAGKKTEAETFSK